jgi:hypothetical protein
MGFSPRNRFCAAFKRHHTDSTLVCELGCGEGEAGLPHGGEPETGMISTIIGAVAFFAIPLLVGWQLVTGLRRGVIRIRGGSYSRASQPRWFWILAATYAGLILFWIAMVGRMVLITLRYR